MKHHARKHWPGAGLIVAGTIVLTVGLTIVLFKELHIPPYWVPAVVGAVLIVAGAVVCRLKNVYDPGTPQDKMK